MGLQPADVLTETLLTEVLQRANFGDAKHVAVMVNNLGATTEMELAIVARHAASFLASKGFSLSECMREPFFRRSIWPEFRSLYWAWDDERLRFLDAATTAPAWPNAMKQRPGSAEVQMAAEVQSELPAARGRKPRAAEKQNRQLRPLAMRCWLLKLS